jgi:hypothetical protein
MLNNEYSSEVGREHPHVGCQGARIKKPFRLEPALEALFCDMGHRHVPDGGVDSTLVEHWYLLSILASGNE